MFSNKFRFKISLEVKRNIFWHLPLHALFAVLIYYGRFHLWFFIPFFFFCIILSLVYKRWEIPGIKWFMDHLERERNFKGIPGIGALITLFTGIIITAFFRPEIGAASFMILAVGDSVAFLIGRFGRIKSSLHENRNIEGVLAGVMLAAVSAGAFVPLIPAFVASIISLLFEFIGIRVGQFKIDDNFYIPLIAAIILTILL